MARLVPLYFRIDCILCDIMPEGQGPNGAIKNGTVEGWR
jgi:hypothetical protein